jgi:hypothetical protein
MLIFFGFNHKKNFYNPWPLLHNPFVLKCIATVCFFVVVVVWSPRNGKRKIVIYKNQSCETLVICKAQRIVGRTTSWHFGNLFFFLFIWDRISGSVKLHEKPFVMTRVEMQDKLQVQFSHIITKVIKTRKLRNSISF